MSQTSCEFVLPPQNDIYLFNDIKIALSARILTDTEPAMRPLDTALVGVVNNVLHSAIDNLKIVVNTSVISNYNEHYNYKVKNFLNHILSQTF